MTRTATGRIFQHHQQENVENNIDLSDDIMLMQRMGIFLNHDAIFFKFNDNFGEGSEIFSTVSLVIPPPLLVLPLLEIPKSPTPPATPESPVPESPLFPTPPPQTPPAQVSRRGAGQAGTTSPGAAAAPGGAAPQEHDAIAVSKCFGDILREMSNE